jgi:hypothetical protein
MTARHAPRDKERREQQAFDRLRAELRRAFSAPEETYRLLSIAEVIAGNRSKTKAGHEGND